MRSTFDFTPYRPSWIGFEHLFDMLENTSQTNADGFPPFDLEQNDENTYRLRLAVAGFTRDDIEITAKPNLLVVAGRREENDERNYLYRGISTRAFERQFQLADYMTVTGARLESGLLEIDLKRELPDAVKPRRIDISAGAEPQKVEHLSRRRSRASRTSRPENGESEDTINASPGPSIEGSRKQSALSGAW